MIALFLVIAGALFIESPIGFGLIAAGVICVCAR